MNFDHDLIAACDMFKQALRCKGSFLIEGIPAQRKPEYYYHIPNRLLGLAYTRLKEPESALVYYKRAITYKENDEIEQIIEKLTRLIELKKSINLVNV